MNATKHHVEGMSSNPATHLVSKLMCSKFQYTSQHTPDINYGLFECLFENLSQNCSGVALLREKFL